MILNWQLLPPELVIHFSPAKPTAPSCGNSWLKGQSEAFLRKKCDRPWACWGLGGLIGNIEDEVPEIGRIILIPKASPSSPVDESEGRHLMARARWLGHHP